MLRGKDILAEKKRFFWQTKNNFVSLKEKELLKPILNRQVKNVLEVGCGEGANIANLKEQRCNYEFFGVDISPLKIKFCKSHGFLKDKFLCSDARNLCFKNNSFDLVFLRDLLHHVDNERELAIEEAVRVCKKIKKS